MNRIRATGALSASLSLALLSACATKPPTQTAFIVGAIPMERATNTIRAQIEQRRDAALAPMVTSIFIRSTEMSNEADSPADLKPDQLQQVLTEIDRQLCYKLSAYFPIAGVASEASAQVEAKITRIQSTNVGSSFVSAALGHVLPGPALRIPIGRGGLTVEAKLGLQDEREVAAMSWSRGAGIAADKGSLSPIGDAHRFGEAFASDFANYAAGPDAKRVAIPSPDPCVQFGPRLDVGRAILSAGTGLHSVPDAPSKIEKPTSE